MSQQQFRMSAMNSSSLQNSVHSNANALQGGLGANSFSYRNSANRFNIRKK